jgi:hypothetical protein
MQGENGRFVSEESVEDRFKRKVKVRTGCWEWLGALDKDNYGTFVFSKERGKLRAHRVAWELFKDTQVPKLVRHTCDNAKCVNPDHLIGGTQKQNIQDALERDRWPVGERHSRAVLTEQQVRYIRGSPKTLIDLANELGVSKSCVSLVRSRINWKHVV